MPEPTITSSVARAEELRTPLLVLHIFERDRDPVGYVAKVSESDLKAEGENPDPMLLHPGFRIGNVHVMAGVPNIFQAMVASVLPKLTGGPPLLSQSLRVDRGEGEIAGPFGALAAQFPDLSMGSYPFIQNGAHGTNLVIRGTDAGRVAEAMVALTRLFG